jgi:hypothetical protein
MHIFAVLNNAKTYIMNLSNHSLKQLRDQKEIFENMLQVLVQSKASKDSIKTALDKIEQVDREIYNRTFLTNFQKEIVVVALISAMREELDHYSDRELDELASDFKTHAQFVYSVKSILQAMNTALKPYQSNSIECLTYIYMKAKEMLSACSIKLDDSIKIS